MYTVLNGIIQTGNKRALDVPASDDTRKPINLARGESLIVRLDLYRDDGTSLDLTSASVKLSVRKNATTGDPWPGVAKTGVLTLPQSYIFTLGPSETRNWDPGQYVYDVWLTLGDGTRHCVVRPSSFLLLAVVTPPP